MTDKNDIRVPEGYFQDLQARLQEIPERPSAKARIAPYLAYAASLVALVAVGNFILGKTAVSQEEESFLDGPYLSYLAQSLDPDGAVCELPEYSIEDDDIVNYLVDEGLTLEEIYGYEEDF